MIQPIRHAFYFYPSLIGLWTLIHMVPAYGDTVLNNGLIRGFNGVLVPTLPSASAINSTAEGNSSSVTIKSSTFVNDQGAGANVSASATSSNGVTSRNEVNQFTPGATSIGTTVNASSSNVAPPSTQITVNTPVTPVNQDAIASPATSVSPIVDAVSSITPPSASINIPTTTAPAIVPAATTVNPPSVVPTNLPNIVNSGITAPPLTQINTPEATFNAVNSAAIAPTLAPVISQPSTTFIPVFSETPIAQNSTVNIEQEDSSNNLKSVQQQARTYEIVGMPSRVWPGLGLTQRIRSTN